MKRVIAYAKGQVQGVGYRASVHRRISRLNVTGYVRNMPDGTVELDIQGAEKDVDEALVIASEGSPFSSVEALDVSEASLRDGYREFIIER